MYDTNVLNNIPEKAERVRGNPVRDSPLSWKKICFTGAAPLLLRNLPRFGAQRLNIHCSLYSPLRSSRAKPVEGGTSQVVFLKTLFWEMMFGIPEITSGECLYIHDHMWRSERPAVKRFSHYWLSVLKLLTHGTTVPHIFFFLNLVQHIGHL